MYSSHVYAQLTYHLVWSTKKQMPWITQPLRHELHNYMAEIILRKGLVPLEVGGIHDHVHLLVQCGTAQNIPALVSCIKANSSRFMRARVADFAWQEGYGVFTVDVVSFDRLQNYIRNQEQHHGKLTFDEEVALLHKRYEVVGFSGSIREDAALR